MYDKFLITDKPDSKSWNYNDPHINRVRFHGSYLDIIRKCVNKATTEYIWVLSDFCSYTQFDFSFRPSPWESKQIHCWSTEDQKYGDTFLIPVEEFKKQEPLEKLEYFKDVHYHYAPHIFRKNAPCFCVDDLPSAVKEQDYAFPYAIYYIKNMMSSFNRFIPSLWNIDEMPIYSLSKSGSVVIVPRTARKYINEQLYDYPHISFEYNTRCEDSRDLDIAFISNGETNAEDNFKKLMGSLSTHRHRVYPRVYRIQDVKGRAQAYKEAAKGSHSEWFYAVFAKLEVLKDFDFSIKPDFLQGRKHWILYSKNPVNGLEYGHMGMIIYNKKLVLEQEDWGLDFTLSARHGIIPITGSIAHYNNDPLMTWRTAFREVIKLKQQAYTIENDYRLYKWLTGNNGKNGDWSVQGAKDAVDYYNEVKGNQSDLMKSFEWDWLNNRFICLYHSQSSS